MSVVEHQQLARLSFRVPHSVCHLMSSAALHSCTLATRRSCSCSTRRERFILMRIAALHAWQQ